MSRHRNRRGFTLPELMVSLLAGLIVTTAVVGLARTATTTFHEQVRSTNSEMSLRLAGQRFAGDLERVSFMGTGNIRWDPQIVHLDSASPTKLVGRFQLPQTTGSRYIELNNLAGIRLYTVGTAPNTAIQLETDNSLRPEIVDLTGNFTTNDEYIVATISPPPDPLTTPCAGQFVTLNPSDAAVAKITRKRLPDGSTTPRDVTEATTLLRSIFLPDPAGLKKFPARVVDPNSGFTHYVIVSDATVVLGADADHPVVTITFVDTATGCPVLWGGQGKGGTSGFGEGLQIAPLQTVRWQIRRVPNTRTDPPEDKDIKYDLTRQFLDAAGTVVGDPEIITEYAIDLKVAFSVDQSPTVPPGLSFDFEDETNNALWAPAVGGTVRNVATDPAPHRIRSVRFRISDRTARDDRTLDLSSAAGFPLRYCVDGAPLNTCKRWARVRTYTSEVALMNQARMNY